MSATPARLPRYAYVDAESAARHAKDTENGLYKLLPGEVYWKDRYFFLDGCGYALRPRYHPDWKPSWIGTNRDPMFCEDSATLIVSGYFISVHALTSRVQTPGVMDATRRSDEFRVAIKSTRNDTQELRIARYLTEQRSSQNH